MNQIGYSAFVLMFAGIIILGLPYLVTYARFVITLRTEYPDVWRSLGSPRPVPTNSIKQCASLNRFIASGLPGTISDVAVVKQAHRLTLYGRIYLAYFFAVLVIFACCVAL